MNVYITMENHHFFTGKSTISMAMFNSYVELRYIPKTCENPMIPGDIMKNRISILALGIYGDLLGDLI